MELRQLEYFVAVAEEANFTRAAARVRVAQPAVSAQVARLERELGQPLLDRTRREARLTPAGRAMLPHARAALSAVSAVRTAVDEISHLVTGSVTLGTVTSHNVDLPTLLADYHEAYPGVEMRLRTDGSDRLIDDLRRGVLDAAIISVAAGEVPSGLAAEVVTDEAIDAAVGPGDEWWGREQVTVTELAERQLIALPNGTGIRAHFESACAAAGVTARVAFEASSPLDLAALAERGLGVAILPESVARTRASLSAVTIVPPLRGRLMFAWRTAGPMSPAARVLVEMARDLLR
jgi:DNA-binding transcriptional LysR family regulator